MQNHSESAYLYFGPWVIHNGRALFRVVGSESQGAPAATAPPPTGGQGDPSQGEPTAPTDGFWGRFPNVPEDMRGQLEPHLKETMGYVTRLEQQYAPFKDMSPEDLQGLANLGQAFQTDPLGAWVNLAGILQQQGLIHDDLDIEALQKVVRGEDPDAGAPQPPPEGAMEGQGLEGLPPAVLQMIQGLQQEVESLKGELQGDRTQRMTQAQDRAFEKARDQVKEHAKGLGWPEELLTDEEITSRFIANRGNLEAVKQSFNSTREGLLKGFVNSRDNNEGGLELPNGVPPSPERREPRPGDSWDKAKHGAAQFLERSARAASQS